MRRRRKGGGRHIGPGRGGGGGGGRAGSVGVSRSLALSHLLSLPASCVSPPSRRSPALPRSRSVFFGRHAEGKVRRRPPDPPRPPWGGGAGGGGASEAHGGPGCPCSRSWQPRARLPVAWLRGREWGRGPRTLLGGISSNSPALRGLESGGWLPEPGSILSPGGGVPCPTWRGTLAFVGGRKWGFVNFFLHPYGGSFRWGPLVLFFWREVFPSYSLGGKIGRISRPFGSPCLFLGRRPFPILSLKGGGPPDFRR